MTKQELSIEKQYRTAERIGILTDGRREPTNDEVATATREADAFADDLEREALVRRVFALSESYGRNRALERRFGK